MPSFDLQPVQQFALQIVEFIPRLFVAIVIYLAFWLVSFVFGAAARRWGDRIRLDDSIRILFVRLTRTTILLVGVITALGTIGIDVSALVAGLGLTTFALGFALQDIIKNVLAGILILMYRPFRRGNYIQVGGREGVVTDIDLRYTTLQNETHRILIPNSNMFVESITVFNQPPSLPK
ncbi:MAG: mechanosensitive ion channel [Chloroflexota bacterium]|nr:mechanosensitive ion channel [Chloroflexota bacterium]